MSEVILLLGPHGVGKSSIINYAKKKAYFDSYEGFKIIPENLNLESLNDFLEFQRQYLEVASELSKKIHRGTKPGLVIRSIEECSYYYYKRNESGNLMDFYHSAVINNNFIGADFIFYLDASIEVLNERCARDTKRNKERNTIWYKNSYKSYDNYWKNNSKVIIIDTSKLSIQEVYNRIKEIYDKRFIPQKK